MRSYIATVAFLAATISAHGNITSPPARLPGPAMAKACGQNAVNNVLQDGTIPLEDVSNPLPSCQLDLCRGALLADNLDRVQTFTPGQVVPFAAQLPIPHEGPANVSIVKTATNEILGSPLLSFASYADERLAVLPANNTAFAVAIPTDLAAGTDCRVAGECVLQWFWFGTGAKQTYESCVDFVVAGGGAGSARPVPEAGGGAGAGSGAGAAPSTGSGSVAGVAPSKGSGSGAGAGAVSGVSSPASSTPVAASSAPSAVFSTTTRSGPQATATPASFKIISADESRGARTSLSPGDLASSTTPSTELSTSNPAAPVETLASAMGPTEVPAPPVDGLLSAQEAVVPFPQPAEATPGSFGGIAGYIPLIVQLRRALWRLV